MAYYTRRHFLKSMAAFSGVLAVKPWASVSAAAEIASPSKALKGKVHAFGMSPAGFPNNPYAKSSILTTLDLATGQYKQTALDMEEGHAAMGALDGRLLCVSQHKPTSMMLDKDHNIIQKFISPTGYVYGGHGLVMRDRGLFILPMRARSPQTLADTGKFEIYDLASLKKLDEVDTGGIQPHEVHYIPTNPNELALTHYGNISEEKETLEFNIIDSKLTILDSATFKPKRHYSQNNLNAMTTHMRVDSEGWAYLIYSQYILYKRLKAQTDDEMHKLLLAEMKRLFGQEWDFPIPATADREKHLAIALPFVRINTQTGETQIINTGLRHHLRGQSVAYNVATGTAIGLYHQSDNLILHKPGREPEVITGEQIGIKEVRGVTEIPGTTRICVCGTYDDIVVMDLVSRQVEAHFTTSNYNSTHLYHEADV